MVREDVIVTALSTSGIAAALVFWLFFVGDLGW